MSPLVNRGPNTSNGGVGSAVATMVNSDNEVQVLKNGRKPSFSRPVSPTGLNAANGQGSESSEDEREGR